MNAKLNSFEVYLKPNLQNMGSVITPSSHFFPKLFSKSSFTDDQNSSSTLKPIHKKLLTNTHASLVFQPPPLSAANNGKRSFLSRNGESLVVTFGTKNGFGEEDNRALETVLKLYTAIKQRNVRELSDVIGDECRCVCNFFSYFHSFYGKKQVLEFFRFLLEYLGKNIEFVVRPTLHDGMNVGVSWKLVWDKKHDVPLGKGISFYMCHVYHGKMVIRNVEMFLEPLVHIEPLQLKVIGFVMSILDKWGWNKEVQSWNKIRSNIKEKRALYLSSTLAVMVVFLFMIGLC